MSQTTAKRDDSKWYCANCRIELKGEKAKEDHQAKNLNHWCKKVIE